MFSSRSFVIVIFPFDFIAFPYEETLMKSTLDGFRIFLMRSDVKIKEPFRRQIKIISSPGKSFSISPARRFTVAAISFLENSFFSISDSFSQQTFLQGVLQNNYFARFWQRCFCNGNIGTF